MLERIKLFNLESEYLSEKKYLPFPSISLVRENNEINYFLASKINADYTFTQDTLNQYSGESEVTLYQNNPDSVISYQINSGEIVEFEYPKYEFDQVEINIEDDGTGKYYPTPALTISEFSPELCWRINRLFNGTTDGIFMRICVIVDGETIMAESQFLLIQDVINNAEIGWIAGEDYFQPSQAFCNDLMALTQIPEIPEGAEFKLYITACTADEIGGEASDQYLTRDSSITTVLEKATVLNSDKIFTGTINISVEDITEELNLKVTLRDDVVETGTFLKEITNVDLSELRKDANFEISKEAFFNSNLTEIEIPNNVVKIGSRAFSQSANLENVNLGRRVEVIGISAFSYCPITKIVIPGRVSEIGVDAFYSCSKLRDITFKGLRVPMGYDKAFTRIIDSNSENNNGKLVFPKNSSYKVEKIIDYRYVDYWDISYSYNFDMYKECTLKFNTTEDNTTLDILFIRVDERKFDYADRRFNDYNKLAVVKVNGKLVNLEPRIHEDTSSYITTVTYTYTAETAGEYVAEVYLKDYYSGGDDNDKEYLTTVINDPNLTTIEVGECTGKTLTTLPYYYKGNFESENSFYDILALTPRNNINISVDKKNIFYNDGNGSNVIIERSTNAAILIGNTNIIPEGVEIIGITSLVRNNEITELTLPKSLKTIDAMAILNCMSLTKITSLAKIAPTLGEIAFGVVNGEISESFAMSPTGTLYYPKGSDYSSWVGQLPSGWNFVEIEI